MMRKDKINFAYAGDRQISVDILKYLINSGSKPKALLHSKVGQASHEKELIELCNYLQSDRIIESTKLNDKKTINMLNKLDLDYIVCIHYPYLIKSEILKIPKEGVINLHPSYLPFNRGWHTPSWAILEGTPAGATLHFMDESVDTGDIITQIKVPILFDENANCLYEKILKAEVRLFKEEWPNICKKRYKRVHQNPKEGTYHSSEELTSSKIQEIDVFKATTAYELFRKIQALTTNKQNELAYFKINGNTYSVSLNMLCISGKNDIT